MAEDESWPSCTQFTEASLGNQQKTILGRCSRHFSEDSHGVELDFEAVKRVIKLGEEHR